MPTIERHRLIRAHGARRRTHERGIAIITALLVLGFLLHVAWRLFWALPQVGPIIHDDEDGYLFAARVLAGGPDATLPAWSIMRRPSD